MLVREGLCRQRMHWRRCAGTVLHLHLQPAQRLHTAQAAQASSSSRSSGAGSASPLFSLEASVGAANPLDLELLSTGAFGAEVHPHLPIATTWHGLYKQLASRFNLAARQAAHAAAAAAQATAAAAAKAELETMADSAEAAEAAIASAGAKPVLHVVTMGAQLRSWQDITDGICFAAGVTPAGAPMTATQHSPHADALLMVSGSHPVRQLPLLQQMLPGSLKMLAHASHLKQQGVLPRHVALWAVANPVLERDAAYTERKIAAGAEVILTQPPLDWPAFEAWLADATARGLPSAARLLIGFPCLTGSANTAFWAALCQASSNAECQRLQQQFAAAEAAERSTGSSNGKAAAPTRLALQWNRQLLQKLQQMPGVGGLHVMPISSGSKRIALQLAQEGAFGSSWWPHTQTSGTCSDSLQGSTNC